jgi:hypothetical protein
MDRITNRNSILPFQPALRSCHTSRTDAAAAVVAREREDDEVRREEEEDPMSV